MIHQETWYKEASLSDDHLRLLRLLKDPKASDENVDEIIALLQRVRVPRMSREFAEKLRDIFRRVYPNFMGDLLKVLEALSNKSIGEMRPYFKIDAHIHTHIMELIREIGNLSHKWRDSFVLGPEMDPSIFRDVRDYLKRVEMVTETLAKDPPPTNPRTFEGADSPFIDKDDIEEWGITFGHPALGKVFKDWFIPVTGSISRDTPHDKDQKLIPEIRQGRGPRK